MTWAPLIAAASPSWTDIGSFAALAAQFAVLLVAAGFAGRQVREARKLREARIRPFVVIDFETRRTVIEIKIANVGATLARDVSFTFVPPLESTWDNASQGKAIRDLNLFRAGISSLPPGKEITALFDQAPPRIQAGLPDAYKVTIHYTGEPLGIAYSEETVLDLSPYWGVRHINRDDIHDVHKRLKEISSEIHGWRAAGGGVKIMTRQDIRDYFNELDALDREQEAQASAEEGDSNGSAA